MYVGVSQRKQNNVAALETPVSICSSNAGLEKKNQYLVISKIRKDQKWGKIYGAIHSLPTA